MIKFEDLELRESLYYQIILFLLKKSQIELLTNYQKKILLLLKLNKF